MSLHEGQPGQHGFGDLIATWREDRVSHGRNIFAPGFQALAVHRLGVWQQGLPSPVRRLTRLAFGTLNGYVRNHYGIELPLTVKVGRHVTFGHQHGIVIHPFSVIGDHCVLRHGVSLAAATGQTNYDRWVTEAPTLGARVKVGVGAVLLGPIHVGDDSRIGPNVVLSRSVPAGSTVVVSPPRIVSAPIADRPARPPREAVTSDDGPPALDIRPVVDVRNQTDGETDGHDPVKVAPTSPEDGRHPRS